MPRGPLARALERSLRALPKQPEDQAAVELARTYARMIDAKDDTLHMLGRSFRETLETLGMTPRARAALTKPTPAESQGSPLDELRSRREQRAK